MAEQIDLTITRGKTFEFGYLYADDEVRQVLITGMPSQVPLRLTVPGHGLPDGWPFWVSCVKSPVELNTSVESGDAAEVMGADPYFVKVVDLDTIEVPGVIAAKDEVQNKAPGDEADQQAGRKAKRKQQSNALHDQNSRS